jgi:hypothetical protein
MIWAYNVLMEEKPLNLVSQSLEETLVNSDLTNIGIELAEIPLDKLLDEGLLKDIPIISTIIGIGKTAQSIKNLLFLKKIIYFMSEVGNIPQKEREDVINEIDKSRKFSVRVGEKLLYIIDKSEDHKSAQIVAKLFSAFLKRKITYSQFLKSSMIVNNVFIDDLKRFVNSSRDFHYRIEDVSDLVGSGLFDIEAEPIDVNVEDQDDYHKSRTSEKYKANVEGGDLKANVSIIGRIIKDVLKNEID